RGRRAGALLRALRPGLASLFHLAGAAKSPHPLVDAPGHVGGAGAPARRRWVPGEELMTERTGAARCEPDTAELSEEQFYAFYRWCLNPVLSLRELLQHLREELDRYPTLQADWQRQESEANQHLFGGAIACTIDHYLPGRPWPVPR